MTTVPAARSLAPDLPFKFVGGDPAVDLVNTVDWTTRGPVDDRLGDYERLTRWAEEGGLVAPRIAARFRTLGAEHPRDAAGAHRGARELRWILRRLFRSVATDADAPDPVALAELNQRLSSVMVHLQLLPATSSEESPSALCWGWPDAADRLDSLLWPVIRSAADLLASEESRRIRECGGRDCGWMYVDRSRNGMRRWCQMEVCGTREKSRRRASKR